MNLKQYTKDNHLYFLPSGEPTRAGPNRKVTEFRDECILAAKEIAQRYNGYKPLVFLSGGIDSEIVAESFRLAEIPFEALIVRLKSDLNIFDICWAVDYCEEKKISYSFFDFDIVDYFSKEKLDNRNLSTGKLYPSYHALISAITSLPKSKKLLPIIGAGEPLFWWNKGKVYYYDYKSDFHIFKFMQNAEIPGVPMFFEWSPELHFSFIFSREIQHFIFSGQGQYGTAEPCKFDLYNRHFGVRKRPKYNGFERVGSLFPNLVRDISKDLIQEAQMTEYFTLLKQINYQKN